MVSSTSTEGQQSTQVHSHPTSTKWTSVQCHDRNKIIQTTSQWNPTLVTLVLGWHTRSWHQPGSILSWLVASCLYRYLQCLCIMWNVPFTGFQGLWHESGRTYICSTWHRSGIATCSGSGVLQRRQENLECNHQTLWTGLLDLWRMPQRDDSSEIRHILSTTTTTSYSQGTSSFARWQRQRRQR